MRVGILTAGGDCPGLNAVIRAAARRLLLHGHEPIGLRRGYRGLAERDHVPLDQKTVSGILHLGGTILSTSNYNPFREPDGIEKVRAAQAADPLDAVIAIGGEHTMMITRRLSEEVGLPVIGVPKTIDNDVTGTDFTFGFDTAVQVVTDAILIPELELTVEEVAAAIARRHERGKDFSIVVVAEGAQLAFESGEQRQIRASEERDSYGYPRLGGIGVALAAELEERTGYETRVTTLGHVQRGGTPTATDRLLATRYGVHAADLVMAGQTGRMTALHGTQMTSVPLEEVEGIKTVDLSYLEIAKTFFG